MNKYISCCAFCNNDLQTIGHKENCAYKRYEEWQEAEHNNGTTMYLLDHQAPFMAAWDHQEGSINKLKSVIANVVLNTRADNSYLTIGQMVMKLDMIHAICKGVSDE
jgi:hypothetical protein